jgi:hypothetical protein
LAGGHGSQFYAALQAGLWIPPEAISWRSLSANCVAQISIAGADEEDDCRLALVIPRRAWPAGNISVVWRTSRVRGLDLDGLAHANRFGTPIETPHFQVIDENDEEDTSPVDLQSLGVMNLEQAFRWFLRNVGIECRSDWTEPPLQLSLERRAARPRRLRPRRERG